MSRQQLLQQVLQSGQGLAQDAGSKINQAAPGVSSALGGFGGGALTGGVLGLLLGNKKLRKMGGGVVAYGGAAALGALALKTYQDWQQKSAEQAAVSNPAQIAPQPLAAPAALPASQLEEHSRTILVAMIAASNADGHIGPTERPLLAYR